MNAQCIIGRCLSPAIIPYVEDAASYDEIVDTLKRLYLKKNNNVYARHLLVSGKQILGESISEHLQLLKILAKECSFTEVSANAYREELTRDSFINGLASSSIRQRLLENDDLALIQVYELADSLDHAQRQAISISRTVALSATTADVALESAEEEAFSSNFTLAATVRIRSSCLYCGGKPHSRRSQCPVIRNASPVANEAIIHAFAGLLLHANQQMTPTGPK